MKGLAWVSTCVVAARHLEIDDEKLKHRSLVFSSVIYFVVHIRLYSSVIGKNIFGLRSGAAFDDP